MSTSDQNQSGGGQGGTGTAATPQTEPGASDHGARHGRGRRNRPGRQEQGRPQQSRRGEATLNMEELRELTELFSAHGLTDFEFENADIRIRLSRNPASAAPAAQPPATYAPAAAMQTAAQAAQSASAAQVTHAAETAQTAASVPPEEELHVITSPIVGTFYRSSSPTTDPFVKVGSQVEIGTVVCIIEAMKLMNEIESDSAGIIGKIYVENGQPVEYGQPLFGVKK
jgi:acetyl-CoA carboxylase biotin carboxyl carrier protein